MKLKKLSLKLETQPEAREETIAQVEPELHIDIKSKFDAVKTDKQLEELEEELTALMGETTLEQRNKLGITSNVIENKIEEKRQQLMAEVTMDNLNRGNIILMTDGTKGQIIGKGKDSIKVRDLEIPSLVATIQEKNFSAVIKTKYSENMTTEKTVPTEKEVEKVKQNTDKNTKFTENKEELKATIDEAYSDEKKFVQDFINNLGCK